ncbi:hypothetical protein GCM10023213_10140 [Prosthecobacter algae]|uniref:Uncharacterized protein n=1 Tax=Prosthecobacter algae TaxID=1144682 RepID=A0ABP9NWX8_9BACT
MDAPLGVMLQDELHGSIAEIAHAIEEQKVGVIRWGGCHGGTRAGEVVTRYLRMEGSQAMLREPCMWTETNSAEA